MKLKELTNFDVRNYMIHNLFPKVLLQIEDDDEELQLQVVVSWTNLFQDSMSQVMALETWEFHSGIYVQFTDKEAEGDGFLREWLLLDIHNFSKRLKTFSPTSKTPLHGRKLSRQCLRWMLKILMFCKDMDLFSHACVARLVILRRINYLWILLPVLDLHLRCSMFS